MIGYVKTAPGFALRLAVSALVIWAFLHAVASAVARATDVPTNSGASVVWVLAVGFMLVAIDARLLRYRILLANLGVSRLGMWLPGWLVVAGAEALFQIARLVR